MLRDSIVKTNFLPRGTMEKVGSIQWDQTKFQNSTFTES
jgi:hypothetical protein